MTGMNKLYSQLPTNRRKAIIETTPPPGAVGGGGGGTTAGQGYAWEYASILKEKLSIIFLLTLVDVKHVYAEVILYTCLGIIIYYACKQQHG